MSGPERVFLGSGPDLLRRAAARLLDRVRDPIDLGDVLVAVPGARAGRILLSLLYAEVRARGLVGFLPPRVMTIGRVIDELVEPERPSADRLVRTMAWERALRGVDAAVLARIVTRRPEPNDRAAWWKIADDVRATHAELAVAGYDFEDVARRLAANPGVASAGDERRFEALAEVQGRWRRILEDADLSDPHEGRRAALDAGRVRTDLRVVLVGVVELNPLGRAALLAQRTPPIAFVFAGEDRAGAFDELGTVRPDGDWTTRPIDLALDQWVVVDGPDDQARMAVARTGGLVQAGTLAAAGDLVIGVPDREVVPFLVRRFAARGVRARDAAGTPIARTAPARLFAGLAEFLHTRSYERLAALLRHADLEAILCTGLEFDPLARFDEYRATHLPRAAAAPIASDLARVTRRDPGPLAAALDGLLGPLLAEDARPLADLARDLRTFLGRVYGAHPLLADDASGRAARELAAGVLALEQALDAIAALPASIAGRANAAGAIELVQRAASAAGAVPPDPAREGEPTVEMLGWLDLALDPASHVIVTGFTEGSVPAARADDALLTRALRSNLGLATDEARVAHDAYTLSLLVDSSRALTVISGRRAREGDPLFPSRLAFARPEEEVLERVHRALSSEAFEPTPARADGERPELPSFVVPRAEWNDFTVTSFKTFIESPALFHIRAQMRCEAVEDASPELDPLHFGTLAHEVLEGFGRGPFAASSDEGAIFRVLDETLTRIVATRFPKSVLATVPLQVEQLRMRLRSFATAQAGAAASGWRIEHVEWSPSSRAPGSNRRAVELTMPGGAPSAWIVGKIDRIDVKANDRLRVLDYKTSHKGKSPAQTHRRGGGKAEMTKELWADLQLPLYALMVRELGAKSLELGYFNLPGDGSPASIECVEWTADELDSAHQRAREIVAEVRGGTGFHRVGRVRGLAPIEEELLGVGLVVPPPAAQDTTEDAAE